MKLETNRVEHDSHDSNVERPAFPLTGTPLEVYDHK
jgi:hypothetical protein